MARNETLEYRSTSYPPVAVTVDVVLFTIEDHELRVLLIRRGVEPFLGAWALPGGFVRPGEDLEAAAQRELEEETGIAPGMAYLEQLRTYGAPERDPRMRVVTVAYWAACASLPPPIGGSDAALAGIVPIARFRAGDIDMAFDHNRIVADAYERLQAKLEYTTLASRFCGPMFTISELRRVYEVIWNTRLDPGNFQRKVRENPAFREVGKLDQNQLHGEAPDNFAPPLYSNPGPARMPYYPEHAAFSESSEPLRPRGGRPPSVWTASEQETTLAAPIFRRKERRARRSR